MKTVKALILLIAWGINLNVYSQDTIPYIPGKTKLVDIRRGMNNN